MFGVSLVHGLASLTSRGRQCSISPLIEFDIKGVLPIECYWLIKEPKISIEQSKDKDSSPDEQPGVLVVELIVEVGHVVGVPLRVVLVR